MNNNVETLPKELFEPAAPDREQSELIAKPQLSFMQDAWMRIRKNKGAVASLFVIVILILMAIIGPHLSKSGPYAQDTSRANLPPRIPVIEKLGIFDGSQTVGGQK